MSAAHTTAAAFDAMADGMAMSSGLLEPPMVKAAIPNHTGGPLDRESDEGLIWCGLLALICGCPDYRLIESRQRRHPHHDMCIDRGAVQRVHMKRDWQWLHDMVAALGPNPWIAWLYREHGPRGGHHIRWGAFDGSSILLSGPAIKRPGPLDEWTATAAVVVTDIEAARGYLATVGRLDGAARR